MNLYYTPTYCIIYNCEKVVVERLSRLLIHDIEEESLRLFIKQVGVGFPFTTNYCFKATLNNENFYNIKFYSGFLRRVLSFLTKEFNITINDLNIESSVEKYVCKDFEANDILRIHQQNIVNSIFKYKRGIIKSPTGSGKTWAVAETVRKLEGYKILITVPTIDLLNQMEKNIYEYFVACNISLPSIGKIGNGKYEFDENITIGIPNSLVKIDKTHSFLNNIEVLISDEVHTTATPTFSKIIENLTQRVISIGLSATPWANGGNNILLDAFFGETILDISESEMIDNNIILQPIFKFYKAPTGFIPNSILKKANNLNILSDAERYRILALVYNYVIINNTNRNKLIVEKTIERIKENVGPVIIIVNKVKGKNNHVSPLLKLFEKENYILPVISGYISKKKREDILNNLRDNKIKAVIAGPKILSTGISIPSLSTIILANAGKSNTEFIQRVGRLLRTDKNKKIPYVIDFIDQQLWFKNQSNIRINTAEAVYGINNIIKY